MMAMTSSGLIDVLPYRLARLASGEIGFGLPPLPLRPVRCQLAMASWSKIRASRCSWRVQSSPSSPPSARA